MDRIMHLPSLDPHEHKPIGADGGQPAPPRASCKSVRQKLKDQPNKQTGWEAFFKCLSPTFAFCLHFCCCFFFLFWLLWLSPGRSVYVQLSEIATEWQINWTETFGKAKLFNITLSGIIIMQRPSESLLGRRKGHNSLCDNYEKSLAIWFINLWKL